MRLLYFTLPIAVLISSCADSKLRAERDDAQKLASKLAGENAKLRTLIGPALVPATGLVRPPEGKDGQFFLMISADDHGYLNAERCARAMNEVIIGVQAVRVLRTTPGSEPGKLFAEVKPFDMECILRRPKEKGSGA